jgi:phosphoadenosine phosphosulfate reductase
MDKITAAIARIKEAYAIAQSRDTALVLAYSGGKDSDVLLDLARLSKVPVLVQHNITTVDAPETCRHIRDVFRKLDESGMKTKINMPPTITTAEGNVKRANMWRLIVRSKIPPTRVARYCCAYFKERRFVGQHLLSGIRWAESRKRSGRGLHENRSKDPSKRIMFMDENDDKRKLIEICQLKAQIITNPIVDWTDADVWCYAKERKLEMNPLYSFGFSRVGCIGCPMAGKKIQTFEFQMYPRFRAAYIRAFDEMLKYRKTLNLPHRMTSSSIDWDTGEAVMEWWINPKEREAPNMLEDLMQPQLFNEVMT